MLRGQVRIAKRTREIYEVQLRLHVLPSIRTDVPALGEFALSDVTPELVRHRYAALSEERGASVAAKAYTRLRQILTSAVNDDRIAKSPCRIDYGGVERHPDQASSHSRSCTTLPLPCPTAAVPDRYRALVVLTAGLAGLREGELFALRRGDIDFGEAAIPARRKRLRLASGEVIEDDPKSAAGRRKVALPATLVAELEQHLAVHGSGTDDDSYVFTSPTGEPLERGNFRYWVLVPATQDVGLAGLRFHDLRHTAGTLAARTGATTKEPMARLGHASAKASFIYQHAAEDRDWRIADASTR